MKHKNAEMIIVKANNTELVVFVKVVDSQDESGSYWAASSLSTLSIAENEFFLCLPQHKDACLHWLNGGSVQIKSEPSELDAITEYCGKLPETNWDEDIWCMHPLSVRIKPKKEKRWIATFPWSGNAFYVTPESFSSKDLLNDYVDMHYGRRELMVTHEIEVEV